MNSQTKVSFFLFQKQYRYSFRHHQLEFHIYLSKHSVIFSPYLIYSPFPDCLFLQHASALNLKVPPSFQTPIARSKTAWRASIRNQTSTGACCYHQPPKSPCEMATSLPSSFHPPGPSLGPNAAPHPEPPQTLALPLPAPSPLASPPRCASPRLHAPVREWKGGPSRPRASPTPPHRSAGPRRAPGTRDLGRLMRSRVGTTRRPDPSHPGE